MDTERLCRLGCFVTASKRGEALEWRGANIGYKFVIVGDNLVVAPLLNHSHVYGAYVTRNTGEDAAKAEIARIYEAPYHHRYAVCGAGTIHQNGTVMSWKSEAFEVYTPEDLREEVERLIIRAFAEGELWREK